MRSLRHRGVATNRLTLYTLRGTFDLAADDGLIAVNPAAKATATGKDAVGRETLTPSDGDLITAHIHGDRLEVCWMLTLCGLRRSEVMGLRWSDLTEGTVTVRRARTDDGATQGTKSATSRRTLPLPASVTAGLRRTRSVRQQETLALGAPWDEEAFVAVDAALEPLRPEVYSDAWVRLLKAAKVPRITLHGARHGSVTRMMEAGVPVHVVQAWHGHADPKMTLGYAHAQPEGMAKAGAALFA